MAARAARVRATKACSGRGADGQLLRGAHLFAELEFRWRPGFFGADQLFLAAADDLAFVEEIDRVDDLVLQEGADIDDIADTAAADEEGTRVEAGIGAVVADVAGQAHRLAVVPAGIHQVRKTLSSETKELKPPPGWAWFWKTAKTFSVIELDSTKSW